MTYGPYHRLYEGSGSVWNGHVGVLVRRFADSLSVRPGLALDLGAGEGDNAFFLASRGWDVEAVEISPIAVARIRARRLDPGAGQRVRITCGPVPEAIPRERYDLVVAYGLLHCFPTADDAQDALAAALGCLRGGGHVVLSLITATYPPTAAHPELESCFCPARADLPAWTCGLEVVCEELETITERHVDGPVHRHEIYRAIARKPQW